MGTSPKSAKGFFFRRSRIKIITINCDLPRVVQRFILAHELGHAVLHGNACETMFKDSALFDESAAAEKEANLFAAEMLLEDRDVEELILNGYDFFSIASSLDVPAELLEFKFRLMRLNGYAHAIAPIIADSKFLQNIKIPENSDYDPA